jgi:hypothetical protein
MKLTEDDLCELFAERVKDSPEFAAWLLRRTKFFPYARHARLLHEEQMSIRPRKRWWRHWWCEAPGLAKSGRETDIFMVFEVERPSPFRFALHIENKLDNGRFTDGQAQDYAVRANAMTNEADYLDHADFATILLAPEKFVERFPKECGLFDAFVSYDDVAQMIPEFAS